MASACRQLASRASLSSVRSAIRSNAPKSPTSRFSLPASAAPSSAPARGFSLTRSTGVLGCLHSLLPLHSAVAAARLTSALSTTSRSCRALSQELGLSVPR
ncbi:protein NONRESPONDING TO OXYLIPINS 2, mitochondrial-like isoform X2 [Argentina anserina]|uniref:protein NONRESPONDING TO OXYLIPINS 2, mitochondrial-like isoform X2 n=1 Tax=Argentina anserina TaxID=57926 RepID=UPI00217653B9|nr:protein NONRESPONDING TO OXYLIPINS 2, mitochondrial-like isoform X2 [Potentilla anserina]